MDLKNDNDILALVEKAIHYNNLLIDQCDKWLPAEEGNRMMEKRIMERKKKGLFKGLGIQLRITN